MLAGPLHHDARRRGDGAPHRRARHRRLIERRRVRVERHAEERREARHRALRHLLGRPFGDDGAAVHGGLGAEVDDVVGAGGDVGVVLDDDDRGAARDQLVERVEDHRDVPAVQAGGGLVEDHHAPALRVAEGRGELEPLGLAAREGRQALPHAQVPEAHRAHRLDRVDERFVVAEGLHEGVGGHVQHVGDGEPLHADLQHLVLEAPPLAVGAEEAHVGEKLHLHRLVARPLARRAPPSLDVEREGARGVLAGLRLGRGGEAGADPVVHAEVGGGVAARGAPEGALVDVHDGEDVVGAVEAVVGEGLLGRHGDGAGREGARDRGVERLADEGALARARHARHAGEDAEREADVAPLEVVPARAAEREPARWASAGWCG